MHVLDERTDAATGFALFNCNSASLFIFDVVSRKCLTKNCDKWAVSGKKNAVEVILLVLMFRRCVETNQSLTSARDAGNKADRFEVAIPRGSDDVVD